MGRYNGDQIANNPTVTANYRRQIVPFSRFQTRKVIWLNIGWLDNRLGDGNINMVALNTLIDTVQTRAEIAIVGAPRLGASHGRMTIGIFENTYNDGNNSGDFDQVSYTNAFATTLQTELRAVLNDSNLTVTQVYLYGGLGEDPSSSNDYGWATSTDYREFETVYEFNAHSYTDPLDL
jgi:hypothetical protein